VSIELFRIIVVDEIAYYVPKNFTDEEKENLVSKDTTEAVIGGPVWSIADVFFNEMTKREIGKLARLFMHFLEKPKTHPIREG